MVFSHSDPSLTVRYKQALIVAVVQPSSDNQKLLIEAHGLLLP